MDKQQRLATALMWLGIVVVSLGLLWVFITVLIQIEAVVLVVIAAVFVAYVLYPLVAFFQRRGLPRWGAIAVVYLILIAILAVLAGFAGPALVFQLRQFLRDLPNITRQLRDLVVHAHTAVIAYVPIDVRQSLAQYIDGAISEIEGAAATYAGRALPMLLSLVTIISALVIVPILAFYILLDADNLVQGFIRLFPARNQSRVRLVLQDVDQVLGGFFRGQVIVAAFVAVAVSIALLLLHIPYAMLIGVFAGIIDMIPYVGAIAGAIPAVLIALATHGVAWAFIVIAAFAVVYEIEGHLVAPNVVGKRVGLTALLVIVAILIGADVGGIPGMFVAVPVAAAVRVVWRRLAHPLEVEPAAAIAPGTPAAAPSDAAEAAKSAPQTDKIVIIEH